MSCLYERMYCEYQTTDIQWNFEKFLINKQGVIVSRWGSDVDPADMATAIKQLLAEE